MDIEEYRRLKKLQRNRKLTRQKYRKVTVLVMLYQKHSIITIEAALGLDDNTIRRYWEAYEEKGLHDYLSDNYVPYGGKLLEEEEEELSEHLDSQLYEDCKSVCDYVLRTYGISYTVSGMRDLLCRLGFVYKRTKKAPSKADDAKQVEFLQETLPELISAAKDGESVLYFADGVHPTHNTKTGFGWIRKGREFTVDCNSGRSRVNVNAACNALRPEHLVYDITDSVNAQSTKRLCRLLLKKHPKLRIDIVIDNARYYKNKELQKWLGKYGKRINLIFLPPYSPNLNVIERLWRFMRKKIINSTYYDSYSKFKNAIQYFLDNIKVYQKELRSLLTLNFRTVDGTSIYSILSQTNS